MNKPTIVVQFEQHVLRLTTQVSALLRLRYGLWILGVISFVESALLLPIITDPFLAAYIMAHRHKAWLAMAVTTATSLFGGFVAYITAAFFIDLIVPSLSPQTVTLFYQIVDRFQDGAFILAFLGAVTPVPFTLVALAAGAIDSSLILFIFGALVGRTLRYGLVTYLTYTYGVAATAIIRRNITSITIVTFIFFVLYLWSTL
jgi:membrane protein YqaA with SNARE-associated domain